jgi:hypothetical protein
VQGNKGPTKEVELHSEFCHKGAVNVGQHLMGCQNVLGVKVEIVDREELSISNFLQALECDISLLVKSKVLLWEEHRILEERVPFLNLFRFVIEQKLP